jgi:hypothetical protein
MVAFLLGQPSAAGSFSYSSLSEIPCLFAPLCRKFFSPNRSIPSSLFQLMLFCLELATFLPLFFQLLNMGI